MQMTGLGDGQTHLHGIHPALPITYTVFLAEYASQARAERIRRRYPCLYLWSVLKSVGVYKYEKICIKTTKVLHKYKNKCIIINH